MLIHTVIQPAGSWDPDGHWDVDDEVGTQRRYLPDGTPVSAEDAHKGNYKLDPVRPSPGWLLPLL